MDLYLLARDGNTTENIFYKYLLFNKNIHMLYILAIEEQNLCIYC